MTTRRWSSADTSGTALTLATRRRSAGPPTTSTARSATRGVDAPPRSSPWMRRCVSHRSHLYIIIGGGSYWAGHATARPLFGPCGLRLSLARPLLILAHTHTRVTARFSGTTQVSRYQKGKTNLDFTEARDSEWQWHQLDHMQVYTSLQTDNHASIPPLSFLQAGCPFCRPTNSFKAKLKT